MDYKNSTPAKVLKSVWGYEEFRENQLEAIESILEQNKDILYIARTSAGKSLVFQLPSLMLDGVAIIISPLLSLMEDQVQATLAKNIRAATYNSTIGVKKKRLIKEQLKKNELDLLYIAPESLLSGTFMNFLMDEVKVSFITFDEAHCISTYGSDFRPKYKEVRIIRDLLNKPVICLTATADKVTKDDIKTVLSLGEKGFELKEYYQNLDRPSIFYEVYPKIGNGFKQVKSFIDSHKSKASGIIYCSTRKSTEELAGFLFRQGYKVKPYHAGLKKSEKEATLTEFLNNDINIVVATIAFGMGIDKPDVRYVIHHSIPSTLEGFSQESGRASRDGLPSKSYLLYSPQDASTIKFILKKSTKNPNHLRNKLIALRKVQDFAFSSECYRKQLLDHFDQEFTKDNCGSCGNCVPVQ